MAVISFGRVKRPTRPRLDPTRPNSSSRPHLTSSRPDFVSSLAIRCLGDRGWTWALNAGRSVLSFFFFTLNLRSFSSISSKLQTPSKLALSLDFHPCRSISKLRSSNPHNIPAASFQTLRWRDRCVRNSHLPVSPTTGVFCPRFFSPLSSSWRVTTTRLQPTLLGSKSHVLVRGD